LGNGKSHSVGTPHVSVILELEIIAEVNDWLIRVLVSCPKNSMSRGRATPWAMAPRVPMSMISTSNQVANLNCGEKGHS